MADKKRVVVGMSGGVDSSVSALLLKQAGNEVIGLFMQNWDGALNNDIKGNPRAKDGSLIGPCDAEQDYQAALQAAQDIGIPLFRVDFIEKYWKDVFARFIAEYKAGKTPNPDILCNKFVKFDAFIQYAKKSFACDLVAMGHYAIVDSSLSKVRLFKGIDESKDQSYFLSQLSQSQLQDVVFPVGALTKQQVRKIAADLGLRNATRADSTGICFIGERDFASFLQNYIPASLGPIVNIADGTVIGTHQGVFYYTVGQRRGIGVSGQKERFFVVRRDVATNTLFVAATSQEEAFLVSVECVVSELNWNQGVRPAEGTYSAKFRYRQTDVPVTIRFVEDKMVVTYPQGVKAVAIGQQLVVYDKKQCLGGGTVESVVLAGKRRVGQNVLAKRL